MSWGGRARPLHYLRGRNKDTDEVDSQLHSLNPNDAGFAERRAELLSMWEAKHRLVEFRFPRAPPGALRQGGAPPTPDDYAAAEELLGPPQAGPGPPAGQQPFW